MTGPPVSVVIVSRGRPEALYRCLIGLSQLQYGSFEIVVIADRMGCEAARRTEFAEALKIEEFARANISAARNTGIALAAGDIVAFIDDDAVPEPSWLQHLIAPFESGAHATGGFVRGRNGISFQWKARIVDPQGHAHTAEAENLTPPRGGAIKTEGTNMAVRRDTLVALGGFDPAYRFFLDETDLNMRLSLQSLKTVIVPHAEVHHGFEASERRRGDRVPTNLFEIGASWAVFQRKFIPEDQHVSHRAKIEHLERNRLVRHLISGGLEPADLNALMSGLKDGFVDGSQREHSKYSQLGDPRSQYRPFPARERTGKVLVKHWLKRHAARLEAQKLAQSGHIVTLLLLSRTIVRHRVYFDPRGFWEQSGGVYGKSDRDSSSVQLISLKSRAEREVNRVQAVRLIGPVRQD